MAVPRVIALANFTRRVARIATPAIVRPSMAALIFSGSTERVRTWSLRAARSRGLSSSTSAIPSRSLST